MEKGREKEWDVGNWEGDGGREWGREGRTYVNP